MDGQTLEERVARLEREVADLREGFKVYPPFFATNVVRRDAKYLHLDLPTLRDGCS